MAIGKKNSGFFKQDAVMGKLSADARKPYKVNAVVAQALEQGKRRKAYLEERAKNHVPRFVKQHSVSLNGPGSDVRAFLGKKKRDMTAIKVLTAVAIAFAGFFIVAFGNAFGFAGLLPLTVMRFTL